MTGLLALAALEKELEKLRPLIARDQPLGQAADLRWVGWGVRHNRKQGHYLMQWVAGATTAPQKAVRLGLLCCWWWGVAHTRAATLRRTMRCSSLTSRSSNTWGVGWGQGGRKGPIAPTQTHIVYLFDVGLCVVVELLEVGGDLAAQ